MLFKDCGRTDGRTYGRRRRRRTVSDHNSSPWAFGSGELKKAECLNEFFTSISIINDDNSQLPAFETKCQNKLLNIVCTPEEIQSLTEILNSNKASGPDGISNKMLKPVAKEVSLPLSILFITSFREGKFAEFWKYSNVIPLPKKGDSSDPSNFRPVSLLCGIGKLQEWIVFKHIHNFLNENDLIYKYQSGFLYLIILLLFN